VEWYGEAGPFNQTRAQAYELILEFWGAPGDQRLFLARATKESVHELGHTYGLSHCEELACVMRFSNTLRDTDQKSDQFGPAHVQQLQEILSAYV